MTLRLVAALSLTVILTTGGASGASNPAHSNAEANAKTKKCTNSNPVQGCIAASNSTFGNAILGMNTGSGVGVKGTSSDGYGVEGTSTNGNGIVGTTMGLGSGVAGISEGQGAGLYGVFDGSPGGSAIPAAIEGLSFTAGVPALYAQVYSSSSYYIAVFQGTDGYEEFTDQGDITISGEIYTQGNCFYGCSKTRGVREYGARNAEATIDDQGEAVLRDGVARVALDPAFANVIDSHSSYVVTLTPEGDCNGLYVADRTPTGFVVRELRGGHDAVAFAYRIVAKRFGATKQRLPFETVALPYASLSRPLPQLR